MTNETTVEKDTADHEPGDAVERYVTNLAAARDSARSLMLEATQAIMKMVDERERLESKIDELLERFNQMSKRRHNVLSASWHIDRRRIGNSVSNPRGPLFYRILMPRKGGRIKKEIGRMTIEICKESFQGQDSGELMRLYREIRTLAAQRDLLTERMIRVRKAIQHVE